MRNKKLVCDECGKELVKTYIISEFHLPITCWVCPKSEVFQEYEKMFKEKYQKEIR